MMLLLSLHLLPLPSSSLLLVLVCCMRFWDWVLGFASCYRVRKGAREGPPLSERLRFLSCPPPRDHPCPLDHNGSFILSALRERRHKLYSYDAQRLSPNRNKINLCCEEIRYQRRVFIWRIFAFNYSYWLCIVQVFVSRFRQPSFRNRCVY